jgi:hypothetical protein
MDDAEPEMLALHRAKLHSTVTNPSQWIKRREFSFQK